MHRNLSCIEFSISSIRLRWSRAKYAREYASGARVAKFMLWSPEADKAVLGWWNATFWDDRECSVAAQSKSEDRDRHTLRCKMIAGVCERFARVCEKYAGVAKCTLESRNLRWSL